MLGAAEYRALIDDSGCAGVVYGPASAAAMEPAVDGSLVRVALSLDRLAMHMAEALPSLLPAPTGPDDPCFWLYSSGTTGKPKGVVHLHRAMAATSHFYGVETLGLTGDDVCYSAAKLFFAYGLGNAMTFPLWCGATAVLDAARPTPESVFANIERFRPTLFFGVPTLYAAQLQTLETASPDLSSLRLCVSAGEHLPAPILERWRRRTGLTILDGIGSTEALHIFISNRPGDVRPGSTGLPVPGYEARVVDDTGDEVPPDTPGELLIRGQSTAPCYWNNPEKTRETMIGDWLRTGDTFSRNASGRYFFHGRSDDMLKVGGLWCSPAEIESHLAEHPAVLEAAVIGRTDADGLTKPEAFVVPSAGTAAADALADELVRHCKERMARYKYPRRITFVTELPKNATGKIQRFKLRERKSQDCG